MGKYEKAANLPEVVPTCQAFLRGKRIATPVCALVRNDMQKAGTCARVQGRGARKVCRRQGVSTGARTSPIVIARSEATGQSVLLAVGQNEKQYFGQIRKSCKFAMAARSCTRRHPASFCMSLRGAKRRGNPFSLRQGIAESSTLGEYERGCEFAMAPRSCTRRHPASFCMSLRGAKRRGNPYSLRQGIAESSTSGEYERGCEFAMAARSCTRRHPASFCMSLRGAKRRGNPFSLRRGIAESSTLGEYERGCGFARSRASLPGFSAGKRIATPVCALVRNDMQKAGTCARVQGRGARKVCRRQGVSTGARTSPTVIARSEATWQSVLSAVGHDRKQYLRRTRKSVYEFARSSASLSSFTAGMRIATPVCALVRNDMLKTERRLRLQGRGARKVCRRQGVSTGARTSPPVIARSEATGQSVLLAAGHSGE